MVLFILEGVSMYELVEARNYGNVVLGRDMACPRTEHRGWGTACKTLTLREDGLYHCEDCGLVYLNKLERYEKMETALPTTQCPCTILEEVIEWWMDEFHGYECPSSRHFCSKCGRHYKTPPTAELEKQQSEGGKKYVSDWMEFRRKEHAEKIDRIKNEVKNLVEALKGVTPEERQELLTPLFS